MDIKEYQFYKEKFNLPTIIGEDEVEGKIIDKYIDGDESTVILFTDNTCLVLTASDYNYIRVNDEWDADKEEYLTALKYKFPEVYKEYQENKKLKRQEAEKKRKYDEYMKLKKEFE